MTRVVFIWSGGGNRNSSCVNLDYCSTRPRVLTPFPPEPEGVGAVRLLVADGSGRVMTTSLPESGDHGLPCGQHREVECALSHSFLYVEVVPMPTGYKSPGFSRATTGAAPTTRIGGKCLQRERSPGSLWRTVVEFRSGHCGHSSTRAGVVTKSHNPTHVFGPNKATSRKVRD